MSKIYRHRECLVLPGRGIYKDVEKTLPNLKSNAKQVDLRITLNNLDCFRNLKYAGVMFTGDTDVICDLLNAVWKSV